MVTFPYIVLPVRAALLHCDRSLEEAGQSLGLNRRGVFWQIIMPQLRPALSAGMLMTALYCLSDFGAVAVMHFNAFTRAIFIQTESYRMDKASVLALLLVGMTLHPATSCIRGCSCAAGIIALAQAHRGIWK